MRSTPEPLSAAANETLTGPPSGAVVMVVSGAAASRRTVKVVGVEVRPARFVAVTRAGCAGALALAEKP